MRQLRRVIRMRRPSILNILLGMLALAAALSSGCESRSSGDPGRVSSLKLPVVADGIYRVRLQGLEQAGMNGRGGKGLRLLNQGVEVPFEVVGEGADAFLEFYGEASLSQYTVTNVYWLEAGQFEGKEMATLHPSDPVSATPRTSFRATERVEKDLIYQPNLASGDRWFWASITAPGSVEVDLPSPDQAGAGTEPILRLAFMGLTETKSDPDHHVEVYLNGSLVTEGSWHGQSAYVAEVGFPQSALKESGNVLRVVLPGDTAAQAEVTLLNWVELEYERRLQARGDVLAFRGSGGGASYTIDGFTDNRVEVFDITDSKDVARVVSSVAGPKGGLYSVSLVDGRPGRKYLAVSPKGQKEIQAVRPAQASDSLRNPEEGADYIIIAPKQLLESAGTLSRWRQEQGLRVRVVDVEAVYDAFGFGLAEPQAIKNFLKFAWEEWPAPRPAYVLLMGDATYDNRDNLKTTRRSLIPSYLISTPHLGETATDNWFVSFGSDERPNLAIGRLPIQDKSGADRVVGKIIAGEKDRSATRERRAMFISDNSESVFQSTVEALSRDYLPSYFQITRVYPSSQGDASEAAGRIGKTMSGGLDLAVYMGHGSLEMLGASKILSISDVASMPSGGRASLVVLMTCLAGYFHHPSTDSLGESLLLADNKGAVAVLASSGLSLLGDQDLLTRGLLRSMFQQGASTLGMAILQAKQSVPAGAASYQDLLETFNLLGDPATPLDMESK